jgi:hypothetical protein
MIKPFKFFTKNDDIPTPQEIRNSPWLTGVFRQGWNARLQGIDIPPPEYSVSRRTLISWWKGYYASQDSGLIIS